MRRVHEGHLRVPDAPGAQKWWSVLNRPAGSCFVVESFDMCSLSDFFLIACNVSRSFSRSVAGRDIFGFMHTCPHCECWPLSDPRSLRNASMVPAGRPHRAAVWRASGLRPGHRQRPAPGARVRDRKCELRDGGSQPPSQDRGEYSVVAILP